MALEIGKMAVPARCTKSNCKFNGVILIHKGKPREESLKKEECPFCHTVGGLELILF